MNDSATMRASASDSGERLAVGLLSNAVKQHRTRQALQLAAFNNGLIEIYVREWDELWSVSLSKQVSIAILDPYTCHASGVDACIRFREEFPRTPLLVYGSFTSSNVADALRLAEAGIWDIVVEGCTDKQHEFRHAVKKCLSRPLVTLGWELFSELAPENLHAVLRYALLEAHRPLQPKELAKVHRCHPKTLRQHLASAGFPPPQVLISWLRLLHAFQYIEARRVHVGAVAYALDFPSEGALRQLVRCHLGVGVQMVLRLGGLSYLISEFRRRILYGSSVDVNDCRSQHMPGRRRALPIAQTDG